MGRKRLLKLSSMLDSIGEIDSSEQALKLYKSSADKDTSQLAFPFLSGVTDTVRGVTDTVRGLFDGGTLTQRNPNAKSTTPPSAPAPPTTANPDGTLPDDVLNAPPVPARPPKKVLSDDDLNPPEIPGRQSTIRQPRFTKLPDAPPVPKDIGTSIRPRRSLREPTSDLQSQESNVFRSTLGYRPTEDGPNFRMERDLPGSSPKEHLQETVMSLDDWCDELLAKVDEISAKLSSDINYALGMSGRKLAASTKPIKQAIDAYQHANVLRLASIITGLGRGETPEEVLSKLLKKSSRRAARLNKIAKLL